MRTWRVFAEPVTYVDERAVDTGGVFRDMYSYFWEKAYVRHFDGEKLLVSAIHPNTDMAAFTNLGTVLVHGFMVCGFVPIRLAFPIIAYVLCGTEVNISDKVMLESLVEYVPTYDRCTLRDAITHSGDCFDVKIKTSLIDILSRLGCTEIPTPLNIKRLLTSVAKHIFLCKPLGMLLKMRAGVPACYNRFWWQFDIEKLFRLYKALNASTLDLSVLQSIAEPEAMNCAEDRMFQFLKTYITNMKEEELRQFLRFVTGSAVLTSQKITVIFNSLCGEIERRPIAHTSCVCVHLA